MPTYEEQLAFLRDDLLDTLRWLFVGAIAWDAARSRDSHPLDAEKTACSPHLTVMAMYTTLNLARTLYEFFHAGTRPDRDDDARAADFATAWDRTTHSAVYDRYMAPRMAVNKRISHLVYNRALRSGATGHAGPDHLNEQVLPCAEDILALTKTFIPLVDDTTLRAAAQSALDDAIAEADAISKAYGVTNRFR